MGRDRREHSKLIDIICNPFLLPAKSMQGELRNEKSKSLFYNFNFLKFENGYFFTVSNPVIPKLV